MRCDPGHDAPGINIQICHALMHQGIDDRFNAFAFRAEKHAR